MSPEIAPSPGETQAPPNSDLLRLSRYPEQHLDQFVHFIGHTFVSNRHTVSHKPRCIGNNWQWRRHGVDWGGHVYSTLLEVAPEIDTNPTSFYRERGKGGRSG